MKKKIIVLCFLFVYLLNTITNVIALDDNSSTYYKTREEIAEEKSIERINAIRKVLNHELINNEDPDKSFRVKHLVSIMLIIIIISVISYFLKS